MNDQREKYIVVYDIRTMRDRVAEGYELVTWTCAMNDPWRFKMRLLQERGK